MLELEIGVVTSFEPHRNKFGFLLVLDQRGQMTKEDVFFHFGDGQFVEIVGDDVAFIGKVFHDERYGDMRMWMPTVGDRLAFSRSKGNSGRDKAAPWTYAEAYENRLKALREPIYRVVKEVTHGSGGLGDTSDVIWEGKGSDAMSAEYPIIKINGRIINPLRPSVGYEAGVSVTTQYRFQMLVDPQDPNSWQYCEDPRSRAEWLRFGSLRGLVTAE